MGNRKRTTALVFLLCSVFFGSAIAADNEADLEFPSKAKELSFFSGLGMGIWKPKGNGPFPAVLIVHTCGGVTEHIGYWRKEAVKRGFVAFVIDSFTSRGSPNCRPRAPISMDRGVEDVLDAVEHLKSFAFVDPDKIALLGFSWGAMAGLLSASPSTVSDISKKANPPTAVVSFYPGCYIGPFNDFPGREYLVADTNIPTLVLMGGKDNETPPSECIPRLKALQNRGAPVEWKVFDDATHGWDKSESNNVRRTPPWAGGQTVVYRFDKGIREESAEIAFKFVTRQFD